MKGRIAGLIGSYLSWNYLVPVLPQTHVLSASVSDIGVATVAFAILCAAPLIPDALHEGGKGLQRGITGWRQTSTGNAQVAALGSRVAQLEARVAGAPVAVTATSAQRVAITEQRQDPEMTNEELALGEVIKERDDMERKHKADLAALDKKLVDARKAAMESRKKMNGVQVSVPVTQDAKDFASQPAAPALSKAQAASPGPHADDSLTCPSCGFKNPPGMPFCTNMVKGEMCKSDLTGGSDN